MTHHARALKLFLAVTAATLHGFVSIHASATCDPVYSRFTDGYTIPLSHAPSDSGVAGQWTSSSGTATHIIEMHILDDGIPSNSQYFRVLFLFRVESAHPHTWQPFGCSSISATVGQPIQVSFVALGTFDGVVAGAQNFLSSKFGQPIQLDFQGTHPALSCLTLRCLNDDSDADGIPNNQDLCPESNLNRSILIGDLDTGVANDLDPTDNWPVSIDANGCSLADHIDIALACAAIDAIHPKKPGTIIHGRFISSLNLYLNNLVRAGMISGADHGAILSRAAQTDPALFLLQD